MRALAVAVAAFLAAGPAVAQDYTAFLKFAPSGRSIFNVALRCTGAPVCRGTYEVSIHESGCSNPLVLADTATLTNMVATGSRSVPTQGQITFASLDVDETRNADGTCSFRELRDLAGTYAPGASGLLSATLVDAKGRTVAVSQYLPYIVPEIGAPALDLRAEKTRIDATAANATVHVDFAAPDVGSVSNIYVFALAPRNLVAAAATHLSKVDAATCILAQLDPGTNRLVGTSLANLHPLVTGILSAQGQLVSVLGNVPTPQVAGTTFFVGYGSDPATMVAQWANRSAVAVPGSQYCPNEMPATPGPLSGLWWNTAESGWGISFTQRRNVVFAAWYGYDAIGRPKWHVASSCTMPSALMANGTCSGSLYEVNGPTFFGAPFRPPAPGQVTSSGNLQVDFQDPDHATMTLDVAGVSRRVAIVRQAIAPTVPLAVDFTDLWWNPSESGWGMSITQQGEVMFLAWYVYDAAGKPTWYVASSCAVNATRDGCTGTLYRTTGPALGPTFSPSLVQVFTAGTVSLDFLSANVGALSYTVNGVSESKVITRQIF